jgi:hypothetical protein
LATFYFATIAQVMPAGKRKPSGWIFVQTPNPPPSEADGRSLPAKLRDAMARLFLPGL